MNLQQTIKKILREELNEKIIYPFDKIGKLVSWFNDEYGDYPNKQGWAIFDSDTELPNEKYHSIRNYKGKTLNGYYWQVQRLDNPEEGEALFGRLYNDFDADRMARKLGLMVDDFGVIYGYDGVSFLDNNIQESNKDKKITCDNCGWSWKLSEGGDDPYVCHKCWNENQVKEIELTEKCWKGYTQKGMKTMFGKRYPNCVKKKKTLKEWYAKRDREKEMGMSYNEFGGIVNNLMGKKYDWWKKLEIESINYSGLNDVISIYGTLLIDREWATQQLKKLRPYFKTEDGEGLDVDDVINIELRKEIKEYLTMLFSTTTNYTSTVGVRLEPLHVRFI